MILYLAQAYSKYEQVPRDAYDMHDAYALAINTYWTLTKMGFEVFSPIMYTHPFHVAMKCPPLDYVAHDLKIIEGFMKDDGVNWLNDGKEVYDSGVVCVFAEDCWINRSNFNCTCAYSMKDHCEGYPKDGCTWEWNSQGAKAEYDFAHTHHIKCIRLTDLLEKKQIEECEPF
jgi:hypothetical protein